MSRASGVIFRSPGVRLAYEPERSLPYGVWIEVRLGTKGWPTYKVVRGRKGWATEEAGVTAYHAASREIAALRAEVEADEATYRALLAPAALPPAPRGTVLFEPLARNWLQVNVRSLEAPKRRKRGRPPAGLRPGERTTDYRRLTLRIPARVHELLEQLARDEHLPQWRIVVDALQRYDATTRPTRKEKRTPFV